MQSCPAWPGEVMVPLPQSPELPRLWVCTTRASCEFYLFIFFGECRIFLCSCKYPWIDLVGHKLVSWKQFGLLGLLRQDQNWFEKRAGYSAQLRHSHFEYSTSGLWVMWFFVLTGGDRHCSWPGVSAGFSSLLCLFMRIPSPDRDFVTQTHTDSTVQDSGPFSHFQGSLFLCSSGLWHSAL